MSIERKLSKPQMRIFIGLAKQREELSALYQEVVAGEQDQLELLRAHFELPEGEYAIRMEPDGTGVMYRKETPAEAELPADPAADAPAKKAPARKRVSKRAAPKPADPPEPGPEGEV